MQYIGAMEHRTVTVTEFKADCLRLLREVAKTGGTIEITRHGRFLASVVLAQGAVSMSPEGSWIGKVTIPDGLLEQDLSDLWEVVRETSPTRD